MTRFRVALCTFFFLIGPLGAQEGAETSPAVKPVQHPDPDIGALSLEIRQRRQLASADELAVEHGFTFSDRVEESGITFVQKVTEDNTVAMKPVHYDHGNGVVAADVDGDGLLDLYFITQLGGNELWKNLGNGRFENMTARAGVAVADRVGVTAAFADYDNDGDPDLFVTTVRGGNILLRNDGEGRFDDVTEEAGVGYSGHSSGVTFFDFDGDGLLDCFVTNVGSYTLEEQGPGPYWIGRVDAFVGHKYPERSEASILYRNLGDGRFRDVSEEVGLVDVGWSGDATITDLNRDGRPDLYVLNMQGADHYWENVDGKRFVEKTASLFPRTPWGAMGVKFFDYNHDGLMDLYLTDMHSDMIEHIGPDREHLKARIPQDDPARFVSGNAFYVNLGEGKFREVSDEIGVENYWPWGVSVDDLNADGADDLFVASSMSYPFRYGINSVFLNDGTRFHPGEFILGVEPRKDGRTHLPWFQLDCSGADQEHERCEGQEGRIEIHGALGTRSSVLLDLENDGDLDIVTNEFGSSPQILVSDLAQREKINFLKVRLVGSESNRDGLGALVKVTAGERTLVKRHDGKSGYLSQSSLPLYFGLGDDSASEVEVEWPSGRVQTITEGIAVNDLMVIHEEAD